MKILAVCGNGLGSSFIIKLNVQKALTQMNVTGEVENTDLTTGKTTEADIYIGAKDIMENFQKAGANIIGLDNLMNIEDIKDKLAKFL